MMAETPSQNKAQARHFSLCFLEWEGNMYHGNDQPAFDVRAEQNLQEKSMA